MDLLWSVQPSPDSDYFRCRSEAEDHIGESSVRKKEGSSGSCAVGQARKTKQNLVGRSEVERRWEVVRTASIPLSASRLTQIRWKVSC